jgi:AhpD family alkylhydroperoxidase
MGDRVRPVPLAEASPDTRARYAGFFGEGVDPTAHPGTGRGDGPGSKGTTGDINTTYALVPGALEDFPNLVYALLTYEHDHPLAPALRELAVLRVAVVTNCKFMYSQHLPNARMAGVSEATLAAVKGWASTDLFDPAERAVMAAADELAGRQLIEHATFEHLQQHLNEAAIVELVYAVAAYRMAASSCAASSSSTTPTRLPACGSDRSGRRQPALPCWPGGRWPRRRASLTQRLAVVNGTSRCSAMAAVGGWPSVTKRQYPAAMLR